MAALTDISTLITTDPNRPSGRPIITGTGTSVRRIASLYNQGNNAEEIARRLNHLTITQIYAKNEPTGGETDYIYDGSGNRVDQKQGSQERKFLVAPTRNIWLRAAVGVNSGKAYSSGVNCPSTPPTSKISLPNEPTSYPDFIISPTAPSPSSPWKTETQQG